jgi:hypothetical protein
VSYREKKNSRCMCNKGCVGVADIGPRWFFLSSSRKSCGVQRVCRNYFLRRGGGVFFLFFFLGVGVWVRGYNTKLLKLPWRC